MRVEILCTGNELLDGSVADSNAAFLAASAFDRGAPVARVELVPDDRDAIASALRAMGERADLVVVSGGLGPTTDDLTVEAAALAAGVPLETDGAVLAQLRERLARRSIAFTLGHARQARVPQGGRAVANPFGSAPMIALRIGKAEVFLLPGVPREFRGLCDEEVLPRLEARLAAEPGRVFVAARLLKAHAIPESALDALVADFPSRFPSVRVGFRARAPENHLKLLAGADSPQKARRALAEAEAEARARLGARLFGADREEFPEAVLAALEAAGATVALAESITGGLCASLLASVPGASRWLTSSSVVYRDEAKVRLLGLDPDLVRGAGAVSARVTRALAEAARERSGAALGLAVTGWAGPAGGTCEDPVGTVYLCLAGARGMVEQRHHFGGDRERIRRFAAWQALDLLRVEARRLAGEPAGATP